MGWEEAGVAWSGRAVDWAYLMEPLFTPVYDTLGSALALKSTDSLLDIGCGGGRGLQSYARHCSQVAGIDAADGLLSIARLRVPQADLRHGSLTELRFSSGVEVPSAPSKSARLTSSAVHNAAKSVSRSPLMRSASSWPTAARARAAASPDHDRPASTAGPLSIGSRRTN